MKERKPGWYWVRHHDSWPWEAAQLKDGRWYIAGDDGWWGDEDFSDIGSRIPTPDEPWVCVPKEPTVKMIHATQYKEGTDELYEALLSDAPKPEDV